MAEMTLGLGIDKGFWLGAVQESKDADELAAKLASDTDTLAHPALASLAGWTPVVVRQDEGRDYIERTFGHGAAAYCVPVKVDKDPAGRAGGLPAPAACVHVPRLTAGEGRW